MRGPMIITEGMKIYDEGVKTGIEQGITQGEINGILNDSVPEGKKGPYLELLAQIETQLKKYN